MKNNLAFAGISDKGLVREKNEDAWVADEKMGLFILSDGMGGRRGGGTASKIVAEALPPLLRPGLEKLTDISEPIAKDIVAMSVSDLSQQVYSIGKSTPAFTGMGATLVIVIFLNDKALIAHLGDSRAYLYRKEVLTRLTKDHSIVQMLVDSGEITDEEAKTHSARSQITRYIGMQGEAIVDVSVIDLEAGDRILLCTDGLTGMVNEKTISEIFKKIAGPKVICRYLLDEAISNGGKDNITAVVIDWSVEEISLNNLTTKNMNQ